MNPRQHPKPVSIRDISIKFSTEEQCLQYIEDMRWPDGIVRCPTCGDKNVKRVRREKASKNKRPWFYLCLNGDCHQQFSPTAGTLFADTHLPLIVWFHAVAIVLNAKKGISALQLQRDLGIGGYKTAWYLLHRVRESMQEVNPEPLGGTVEIDETYVGGRQKGKGVYHAMHSKQTVMGAVQRRGKLRLRHAPDSKAKTIRGFIAAHISKDAENIFTDMAVPYPFALAPEFTDRHQTVNHIIGEYVRGDVYTNTIESAFSLIKRGIMGQYHWLSIRHLHRYLREFEYRFNRRNEADPFIETVRRLCGFPPLRFAELTSPQA
jgi:transposase-like protein